MPVQEVKETKPIVQNNKSNQLLIDKIQSNEGKLTTLQEQIISNESNEKINLLFEDVLIVNFENNNISKKSANNLFSYVFSQYTNNIEKDNDDNAKDELISSLVNIISISLHCNNNEKDKKELYDYLSKLYDQDETEEFQQNFYDIFNKVKNHLSTDIIEQDEKNEVSIKQKLSSNKGVIKNIMESFPSTININTLNEILYKNKVYLTKEEYLYLCYKIKHSSGSIRDLSTKELSKLIEEPKPLLNEIIGSGGGPLDDFYFPKGFEKALYEANVKAGVDYMGFGYKADKDLFDVDKFGPCKFCDDDFIRDVVGENDTDLKIAAMADVGRCNFKRDILPKSESPIDLIRVACVITLIPMLLLYLFFQKYIINGISLSSGLKG